MDEQRLKKLAGYATTMAQTWIDARQKVTIFRGLQSEELRQRLSPSHGAIAYNVLARTLLFDLIRDVWALRSMMTLAHQVLQVSGGPLNRKKCVPRSASGLTILRR